VRRRLGARRVEVAELVVAVARLVHHQHVVDLVLAAHLAVLLLQQQAGRVHALAHLGALLRLALQRLQLVARLVQLGRQPLVLVTLAYLFAVLLLDVQVPRLALLVVRLEPLHLGAQLGDALRAHALRVLQLLQLVEAAAARELLLQLLRLPLQPPDLLELLVHLRLALLLFGRRLLLGLLLLAHLRQRLVHLVLQRLQVVAQVLLVRAQLRQRRHLHRQVRLLLEVVHRGQRDLALVLRLELLVDPLAHALLRERRARRPRLSRRHRPLTAVSGLQAGQLRVQRRPVVVVQQHPDRAPPLALLLFLVARLLVLLLLLLVVLLLGQRLEQPQLLDDARLHLQQLAHAEHGRGAARLLALSQQLHAQLVLRGHDPLQRLLPHELAALGRRHRLRLLDAEAARPHGVVSQLRPQPAVAQLFAPDGLGRVHDQLQPERHQLEVAQPGQRHAQQSSALVLLGLGLEGDFGLARDALLLLQVELAAAQLFVGLGGGVQHHQAEDQRLLVEVGQLELVLPGGLLGVDLGALLGLEGEGVVVHEAPRLQHRRLVFLVLDLGRVHLHDHLVGFRH
jgi:hypothetical protein